MVVKKLVGILCALFTMGWMAACKTPAKPIPPAASPSATELCFCPIEEVPEEPFSFFPECPVLLAPLSPAGERLAEGIYKWKTVNESSPWWECGLRYTNGAAYYRAREWAYNIEKSTDEIALERGEEYRVNPWGVAATTLRESAFDLCALGTYPTKTAYKHNLLAYTKGVRSHKKADVLKAVTSPVMKKKYARSGVDLGGLQLLTQFYKGPAKDMMEWKGYKVQITEMAERQVRFQTKYPWRYWKTLKGDFDYDARVRKASRMLGATRADLF